MLPPVIPIFPLPTAVLFPNVLLPLHIFEPRYRQMLADALAGDRVIGMALLRAGWEDRYEGNPPVYAVGCAGVITHVEPLPDGRSNIVLRGLSKFRIQEEDGRKPYRLATVEPIEESVSRSDRERLFAIRSRVEEVVLAAGPKGRRERQFPPDIPDEDLINALSQYLELEPLERQALLECPGVVVRAKMLLELLEMKVLAERPANGAKVH
ncbi:MAG TPA: LON peptidase substrate-binding domain-containing protein [Vicinamibacterales bacterium]|nr:LON peptidase substrate-binding domain-containing protein [Vicinamibacterales bacterium]